MFRNDVFFTDSRHELDVCLFLTLQSRRSGWVDDFRAGSRTDRTLADTLTSLSSKIDVHHNSRCLGLTTKKEHQYITEAFACLQLQD